MTGVFLLILLLLTAVAVAAVILPLLKPPADAGGGGARRRQNIAAAKARLQQLAGENLPPAEEAAQRDDIARLLLAEAEAAESRQSARGGGRWLAGVVALLLPLAAAGMYWHIGAPQAVNAPPVLTEDSLAAAVANLRAKLAEAPNNAGEWLLLAKSLATLERHGEAADAFAQYRRLAGDSPAALVGEAEALTMRDAGRANADAAALLRRALALAPDDISALWLAGVQARLRGDNAAAAAYWRRAADALADFPDERAEVLALAQAAAAEAASGAPGETIGAESAAGSMAADAPGGGILGADAAAGGGILGADAADAAGGAKDAAAGADAAEDGAAIVAEISAAEYGGGAADAGGEGETLFVFARAAAGGPPIVAARLPAALPATLTLHNGQAMIPGRYLSADAPVVIVARLSKSGNAIAAAGDRYGESAPITPPAAVAVTINKITP